MKLYEAYQLLRGLICSINLNVLELDPALHLAGAGCRLGIRRSCGRLLGILHSLLNDLGRS